MSNIASINSLVAERQRLSAMARVLVDLQGNTGSTAGEISDRIELEFDDVVDYLIELRQEHRVLLGAARKCTVLGDEQDTWFIVESQEAA